MRIKRRKAFWFCEYAAWLEQQRPTRTVGMNDSPSLFEMIRKVDEAKNIWMLWDGIRTHIKTHVDGREVGVVMYGKDEGIPSTAEEDFRRQEEAERHEGDLRKEYPYYGLALGALPDEI